MQRFGAPEYDSRDKSIRIWSSKALKLTNHQVSNAFAVRLVRKPDRLNAAAVVVLELLFQAASIGLGDFDICGIVGAHEQTVALIVWLRQPCSLWRSALRVPCWRWWVWCHEDKSAVCCLRTLDAALTGVETRRGDAKGTRRRNVPVFSPE